ncbi:helix-turn-helix domain-containing protein [Pedobacter nyackensis]|uniref:helix-turn-helix domain-containing protein n=1 Tax=Pedobacter nyackensis TaxID=475255 RepID=UPI00292FE333|nr:helix-turn-helix domain-containing protein [Pedobacter nyackensis]
MMIKSPDVYKDCSVLENSVEVINRMPPDQFYHIHLFKGNGNVNVDLVDFDFDGNIVLFTTPYQNIRFEVEQDLKIRTLLFHGDFYCIEYHKKEVACNGLLFNNIYSRPFIVLNDDEYTEMHVLFDKLAAELSFEDTYSVAVVRAYLQLMLALSSKVKIGDKIVPGEEFLQHPINQFKTLLDVYFKKERSPSFYAEQLGIASNTFSKQCRTYFLRSPSQIIQDRVILEAKKLIHLTYKSMKEIAAELNFDDENYFSRYFKKHTGITPTTFRENVGISVVADLSR